MGLLYLNNNIPIYLLQIHFSPAGGAIYRNLGAFFHPCVSVQRVFVCVLKSSHSGGGLAQRLHQQRPATRTSLHPTVSPAEL